MSKRKLQHLFWTNETPEGYKRKTDAHEDVPKSINLRKEFDPGKDACSDMEKKGKSEPKPIAGKEDTVNEEVQPNWSWWMNDADEHVAQIKHHPGKKGGNTYDVRKENMMLKAISVMTNQIMDKKLAEHKEFMEKNSKKMTKMINRVTPGSTARYKLVQVFKPKEDQPLVPEKKKKKVNYDLGVEREL